MPRSDVNPESIRLAADAFERRLPTVLPRIVSSKDFEGFHEDEDLGAPPCNYFVLTGMLLLQYRYGLSDAQLVERCRRDLGFKYAVGLRQDEEPPSTSSLKRHRANLRARHGDGFLHRKVLALAVQDGLIPDANLQAIDSTNTDCRGAVIDTFNLIATAILHLLRQVARCLDLRPAELAGRWELTRYLARSIKGQVPVDWSDPRARNGLLTREIEDADRLAQRIAELDRTMTLPHEVNEAAELLRQVARQDVEPDPAGGYRIAKGTAPGRIISITDPEARHGRKSSSKVINGFKTHITGTLQSQFVIGIALTDASVADAAATPELIRQTEANGLKPEELVGDMAYGTGANLRQSEQSGVEILTKLPSPSHPGSIAKREFEINLSLMTVTCPQGVATAKFTRVKDSAGSDTKVPMFHFDKQSCRQCPRRLACSSDTAKGTGRKITLSVYERELQKTKAFNRTERAPAVLRSRCAIERLLSHLVRLGMRHARFFGMYHVQFQAFMTAAAYNLQRYITLQARTKAATAA